MRTLEIHSIIL